MLDFDSFCQGISFRLLQPHEPVAPVAEEANTVFPENDALIKQLLAPLAALPKMSTLALGAIIQKAVSQMPAGQAYVNIGVWHGYTLFSGMVHNPLKKCIGVDNFSQFGSPRNEFMSRFLAIRSAYHSFYEMDYVDFFRTALKEPIGFYIYDGEHSYEHQLKGLTLAEPFFAQDCRIMIDDTNGDAPRQATLDFIANSPHTYQVVLDASTQGNAHPTFWNGVMLFQKMT